MTAHDTFERIAVLLLALALVATPVGAGVAASGGSSVPADHAAAVEAGDATQPAFVVALQPNGDATVTLRLTYDLDSDDERTAFRSLENDSDTRATAGDRFRDRMASVAAAAENATGRDMAISNASVALETVDGVGVVELSVTWTGLAATQSGTLVLTEPLASGFQSDRPVVVKLPDGYSVDSVTPKPAERANGSLTWSADTNLEGFELVASADGATSTGQSGPAGVPVPGFGLLAALLALLATVALLGRS